MKLLSLIGFVTLSPLAIAWTHTGSNLRGWATSQLVFSVNTANCTIANAELFSIIDEAINAWNGVPTANLSLSRSQVASTTTVAEFVALTATDSPLIFCDPSFATSTGADSDYVPAAAQAFSDSSGELVYGGVYLNAQLGSGAEISGIQRSQMVIILAHEIGHVLGLGHSSNLKALMYYSVAGKTTPVIAQDDMDGITHLYPRSEGASQAFGCAAVHRQNDSVPMVWLVMAMASLLGTLGLGRFVFKPERLL